MKLSSQKCVWLSDLKGNAANQHIYIIHSVYGKIYTYVLSMSWAWRCLMSSCSCKRSWSGKKEKEVIPQVAWSESFLYLVSWFFSTSVLVLLYLKNSQIQQFWTQLLAPLSVSNCRSTGVLIIVSSPYDQGSCHALQDSGVALYPPKVWEFSAQSWSASSAQTVMWIYSYIASPFMAQSQFNL